jgi:hypothetical protein
VGEFDAGNVVLKRSEWCPIDRFCVCMCGN